MTIRFLLDGGPADGDLGHETYLRPWYVHDPAGPVTAFTKVGLNNLQRAILAAQLLLRSGQSEDIWISTDAAPPAAGWPAR